MSFCFFSWKVCSVLVLLIPSGLTMVLVSGMTTKKMLVSIHICGSYGIKIMQLTVVLNVPCFMC